MQLLLHEPPPQKAKPFRGEVATGRRGGPERILSVGMGFPVFSSGMLACIVNHPNQTFPSKGRLLIAASPLKHPNLPSLEAADKYHFGRITIQMHAFGNAPPQSPSAPAPPEGEPSFLLPPPGEVSPSGDKGEVFWWHQPLDFRYCVANALPHGWI